MYAGSRAADKVSRAVVKRHQNEPQYEKIILTVYADNLGPVQPDYRRSLVRDYFRRLRRACFKGCGL